MPMDEKENNRPFQMTVRRCRRCGGILIGADSVFRGIGKCCERKEREERQQREQAELQISLFGEDHNASQN